MTELTKAIAKALPPEGVYDIEREVNTIISAVPAKIAKAMAEGQSEIEVMRIWTSNCKAPDPIRAVLASLDLIKPKISWLTGEAALVAEWCLLQEGLYPRVDRTSAFGGRPLKLTWSEDFVKRVQAETN